MDLGYKDSMPVPASPSSDGKKEEPKKVYPEFTIRGEPAKEQLDSNECEPGEEYTATVRLRAKSVTKNDQENTFDGTSVRYEVISMDNFKEADSAAEEEAEGEDESEGSGNAETGEESAAEEKALGYKRPKKSESETPKVSAKDLQY